MTTTVIHTGGDLSYDFLVAAPFEAVNFLTGASSIYDDTLTLFDNRASGPTRWAAAGDLVMNVGMDALMVTGIGEEARVGELTLEGGEKLEGLMEGESCSFTALTRVATATGELPIGTLHVGQKVLAYNPKTHKMELQPILHVWIHNDNDLVDLTLTTVTHAPHSTTVTRTSETLHTNKKHPFFTVEKGVVPVSQLKIGMHVLRADGRVGVITGWKIVPGVKEMYNLTVAHDHTFVVGVGEWIIHNVCIVQDACNSNSFNDSMRKEVQPTLGRINQNVDDPHANDGDTWNNNNGDLPLQPNGYYKEYVHRPSGTLDIPGDISSGPAGAQRIIKGAGDEIYYSPYYYKFVIYQLY